MQTLVTGISGYVGALVAAELTRAGHEVRGYARTPEKVEGPYPVVEGDLSTGTGLTEALAGVDVAYYLVHSMEGNADYTTLERRAAERFAVAAADAGVGRIVYMSVLVPDKPESEYSSHVRSRLAVEAALGSRGAEVVTLRASIVIGANSRSFRFLLQLVERMPVLPLPPWRSNRTSPIDERDLVRSLVLAATAPVTRRRTIWDAVGIDVVTYQELISEIAGHLLISRPIVPFPFPVTSLTAPVAAAISGEDLGLVHPLIQSLGSDLLARPDHAPEITLSAPRHRLHASIEHALRDNDTITEKD